MASLRFTDAEHEIPPGEPRPLDRVLRDLYPGASWSAVRRLAETGKITVDGELRTEPQSPVAGGARLAVTMSAPRRRDPALADVAIVHVDAQVVVAAKPPGISTVPYDEKELGTLADLVRTTLERRERRRRDALGVVHRIDKETSGLVVFARTLSAKRHLEQQFRQHSVHRRYLAIVNGAYAGGTITSRLVADRGDGLRGSTDNPRLGRVSTTHVRVLESFAAATFVECRLETGRTHQIRIHLSESGHPLAGERVYVRNYPGPLLDAPRLMLHAAELGFVHPASGRELRFSTPLPADVERVLTRLRGDR